MKTIAAVILLSASLAVLVSGKTASRDLLDTLDDQCMDYVAYCDKKSTGLTALDGQCRPNIWVWLVVAGILLILVGSCICCLLCGLCKCILDCLCCCCRGDQGYTPANTGV